MGNSLQIGTLEVVLAIAAYILKQWWDEKRRVQAKRETIYLEFGEACARLESAVALDDDKDVESAMKGVMSFAFSFHLFSSRAVGELSSDYLDALAGLAGLQPSGTKLVDELRSLSPLREKLAEAMRVDVLQWTSFESFTSFLKGQGTPKGGSK